MQSTAIENSFDLVIYSIEQQLGPLVAERVFWQQGVEQAPLPLIVYHSQDLGGQPLGYIGAEGWEGLITVRCFAQTNQAARELAHAVARALNRRTFSVGLNTITWKLVRPVPTPPANQRYIVGYIFDVEVH